MMKKHTDHLLIEMGSITIYISLAALFCYSYYYRRIVFPVVSAIFSSAIRVYKQIVTRFKIRLRIFSHLALPFLRRLPKHEL